MKVKSVSSHILRAPLGAQKFYSSQAAFPERNSYLVRVETDSGLVGWGEGGQYGPPEPVAAIIDAVFVPQLIGRDPTEPVRILEEVGEQIIFGGSQLQLFAAAGDHAALHIHFHFAEMHHLARLRFYIAYDERVILLSAGDAN